MDDKSLFEPKKVPVYPKTYEFKKPKHWKFKKTFHISDEKKGGKK